MFQIRWRWNVTRALAVLRQQGGKQVPPHLQRFRADDCWRPCFPKRSAAWRIITATSTIPDHPLVRQTMHDCLHEAMDIDALARRCCGEIEAGEVELVARDTREPSPFSHELLNANPYAFLDDAPLEERRTRAVHHAAHAVDRRRARPGRLDPDGDRPGREPKPGRWSAMPTNCTTPC